MIKKVADKALEIVPLILGDYLKFSNSKYLKSNELRNLYGAILFKTVHSFEASLFFVPNFETKPFFQLAFGSILRDIISDLVLAEYLSIKNNDPKADINKILNLIYADHDLFTDKQGKLNRELFGDSEGYDEVNKSFQDYLSKYKDAEGKIKKEYKSNLTVFKMIGYINSQTKKSDKDVIKDFYEWYNDFSKLAHFGKNTIPTIQNRFIKGNKIDRFYYYKNLIETILMYCISLLIQYSPNSKIDMTITEKFKELCEFEHNDLS